MFDSDSPEAEAAKLERAVAELLDGDGGEVAAHLTLLIGIGRIEGGAGPTDPFPLGPALRRSPRERQPTVLVFEDIHVAGASMLDLLETLASRRSRRPAPARDARAARAPLGAAQMGRRAARVYGVAARAPRGRARGRARAEAARGRRRRAGAGRAAVAGRQKGTRSSSRSSRQRVAERGGSDELPASIRSMVAARLDALPPARARRPARRFGRREGVLGGSADANDRRSRSPPRGCSTRSRDAI